MTYSVYSVYADILRRPHTLIAGATGSGKSVTLNSLIKASMGLQKADYVLIDLKRVELAQYRRRALRYADTFDAAVAALEWSIKEIDRRYKKAQWRRLKAYDGRPLYVIIDELADLMTVDRRRVQPLIQRIGQIGRAANVHMIACTQCPLVQVIPTPIKVNFTCIIGLRTATAQHSRNIIGVSGCELLPDPRTEGTAYGYIRDGANLELWHLPAV